MEEKTNGEVNFYYETFAPFFKERIAAGGARVWDETEKMLADIKPDPGNKTLMRLLTECFSRLSEETEQTALSLYCLSYLISLCGDTRHYITFLEKSLRKTVPANALMPLYYYTRSVSERFLYFNAEEPAALQRRLYDAAFAASSRFLKRETAALPDKTAPKTAVFIADTLGDYPYGAVKHITDICGYYTGAGYGAAVFVTNESAHRYGALRLYRDKPEQSAPGARIKETDRIAVFEFGADAPYVSSAKAGLARIINSGAPDVIINFAGDNIFARLLSAKYPVAQPRGADFPEAADTQKKAAGLIDRADKYYSASDYEKTAETLEKAYGMLKNRGNKAQVLRGLARTLEKAGRYKEAAAAVKSLEQIDNSAEAAHIRADAEAELGNIKNAVYLREAIEKQDPDDITNNITLCRLYLSDGRFADAEAKQAYFKERPGVCDHRVYKTAYLLCQKAYDEKGCFENLNKSINLAREGGHTADVLDGIISALSSSLYSGAYSREEYAALAKEFKDTLKPPYENRFPGYVKKERKIRLGFLSGATARHPVGFFIAPLFEEKPDSGRFEYCYYDFDANFGEDETTALIEKNAAVYRRLGGAPDAEIAKAVLSDKTDVLIDLNGLSKTQKAFILSTRLAPVQMTWIGFPTTLPVRNMDYNIADRLTDPPGVSEAFYTEELLYLPKTFLCYGKTQTGVPIKPPPCTENGYVTFGSFNNGLKYSEEILRVWAKVFAALPDARLLIRTPDADSAYRRAKLTDKFKAAGLPLERVAVKPAADEKTYYGEYNKADIILDTYPFNGATTTCDAFLMGTPIITLYGDRHVSRVGLSMLTNIGAPELAAGTPEEFIKIAAELANDKSRIINYKKTMRDKALASPLFDRGTFRRDFEAAVYDAYRRSRYE